MSNRTPFGQPHAREGVDPSVAPAGELPGEILDARGDLMNDVWRAQLRESISRAEDALVRMQDPQGYWCFELEADCTIPAEYILMMHFMDEIDAALQARLALYLREHQADYGGWPLYFGGDFDMSCSVKAYYALKLAGDDINAPHMVRAREAILARGGAARSNVFTRIALAMFRQVPWRAVPWVPVEIILLPRWFPFSVDRVSYWSRTVMIPLAILCTLKVEAKNPRGLGIEELFTLPANEERNYFPVRSRRNRLFLYLERTARLFNPLIPRWLRNHATRKAESWVIERLNGEDGLGAIFPAMVNAYESLAVLGYPEDHPHRVTAKRAIDKLLVDRGDMTYCQPCVSPVWDTALAALAVLEVHGGKAPQSVIKGLDWLQSVQCHDEPADWRDYRPDLEGGGWAFQFRNAHYPDLDDTAVVVWAMHAADKHRYADAIRRAADWTAGMQSQNGGFAAFDADNTCYYLNDIPFADHGALLDPPTSDVSARCAGMFGRLDEPRFDAVNQRCIAWLKSEQETSGAWFGRWGTNYIYGTWSVLVGLTMSGESPRQPYIQRAVKWLHHVQRSDGGWGESNDSYMYPDEAGEGGESTAFQTAWALLALMAAGEVDSPAVRRGIEYLVNLQQADGLWTDGGFTAPGFPRVFYLKYHGYDKFFPLWALARYYNLQANRA